MRYRYKLIENSDCILLPSCSNDYQPFADEQAKGLEPGVVFHSKVLHSENARVTYDSLKSFIQRTHTRTSANSEYPDYYGGCYVDSEGNLVVLYKHKNVNLQRIQSLQAAVGKSAAKLESCDFSYNELLEVIRGIDEFHRNNPDDPNSINSTIYYLNPSINRVVVCLTKFSEQTVDEFKEHVSSSSSIVFRELAQSCENVSLTIKSGSKYYVGSTTTFGSFGYRAKKYGGNGFVTSGHVISVGQTATTNSGSTTIGNCIMSQVNSSIDAAYVSTGSNIVPSNIIAIDGGTLSASTYSPLYGETVNLMGATTLGTSGAVTGISVSIYDTETKLTTSDLIQVNCASLPGDSGGIAYVTNMSGQNIPVGIIKATNGTNTYCVYASKINTALGVTMY